MKKTHVCRMLKKISVTVLSAAVLCGTVTGCQKGSEPQTEAENQKEAGTAETEGTKLKDPEADTSEVKELSINMLDKKELENIQSRIDPEYAYDFIYKCSKLGNDGNELGFRNAGSTGEKKAQEIIEQEMKALGLQDVAVEPFDVDTWEFTSADVTTSDGTRIILSALAGSVGLDNTLDTEMVWLGKGTAADYEGKDVKGKAVLIEFDNMADYWFSAPQYEAELHGAAAVICSIRSEANNMTEEGMLCFDGCLRTTIPCLSISKKDCKYLREQIDAGKDQIALNAKMTVKPGQSANIIGYIKGKNPDHIISLGGHYDGWYHSFQDDLYGVGMELAIAKAILESEYQPEYTIAFIAFGSEEYGVADTVFDDWCIGAWSMVSKNHPEWVGKALAHLEFDSIRPDMDTYCLNTTPELDSFFRNYAEEFDETALPEQVTNGIAFMEWAGPWSQDYSFTRSGIPGIASRQSSTEWKRSSYHTQFDDETAWNEELFRFHAKEYMQWLYTLEHAAIVPLDFSNITEMLAEGLDTTAVKDTEIESDYMDAVEQLGKISDKYYTSIQRVNMLYTDILKENDVTEEQLDKLKKAIEQELSIVLEVYKMIEDDFVGMDQWQTVAFRDQYTAANYQNLLSVKEGLEKKDGQAALNALAAVDTTYLTCFSKAVYEYVGITGINGAEQWAKGKVVTMLDTYDTWHAIQKKVDAESEDFEPEIKMVDDLLKQEQAIIKEVLEQGSDILNQAAEKLEASDIASVIELEEKILGL